MTAWASPPERPFVQGESVFVANAPRPLSDAERVLVEHLARALPAGALEQVAHLRVIGTCRCPCGSLQLDPGPVEPVPEAALAAVRGSLPGALTASARSADGATVALHLVLGQLLELETYAGDDVSVPLPSVDTLGAVEVS